MRIIEDKNKFLALIFFVMTILSAPLAYTSLHCHSYAHEPFRFVVDMLLRILLMALPFCLGLTSVGYYKDFSWARRAAVYSAWIFAAIIACIIILM